MDLRNPIGSLQFCNFSGDLLHQQFQGNYYFNRLRLKGKLIGKLEDGPMVIGRLACHALRNHNWTSLQPLSSIALVIVYCHV